MPTMGLLSGVPPVEPKNGWLGPKVKIPPSEATSQYPAAKGETGLDGREFGPVPRALVADTMEVYETPLVRPDTMAEVADPLAVAVAPPGETVTVYAVIGLSPLNGAVQWTFTLWYSPWAVTFVGAPGTD
jgi:hypothetical protein